MGRGPEPSLAQRGGEYVGGQRAFETMHPARSDLGAERQRALGIQPAAGHRGVGDQHEDDADETGDVGPIDQG